MLFEYLVSHRFIFIACVYGIAAINYFLGLAVLRAYGSQQFVVRDEWVPPGIVGRAKSYKAQLALPLVGATLFSVAALAFERSGFEFFLGGFLCLQLLALQLSVTNILSYRSLGAPEMAEGRISYSRAFRYRNFGAHSVGGATLALVGFAFTGSPALAGAALFGAATAAGAYRRARQAAATAA